MARKIGEPARTRSRKSSAVSTNPGSDKSNATPAVSKIRGRKGAPANSLSNSAKSKTSTPKRLSVKRVGAKSAELKENVESATAIKSATKEESKAVSRIAARILAGKLMPTLEQVRALAMSVLGHDEKGDQGRSKGKRKGKTKSKAKSKK